MKFLFSVAYWLFFGVTSPLVFVAALLVLAATAPFDPDRRALHAFVCRATFLYLRVNPFWDVRVEGRERLPSGPCVIVANHQSMADVVAVMGIHHPYKYVSKASLFRLPLVGWTMRLLKYVSLERGSAKSTQRMMDTCRAWLKRGMPVLIYPEGTYSEGKLLPFKRGAFVLAAEEQLPLVPVLLEGTTSLIHGDGPWFSPTARVRVTVQAPVLPQEYGGDGERLAAMVRERYLKWLGQGSVEGAAVVPDV